MYLHLCMCVIDWMQLVKDSTTRQCAVIERRLGQKLRDAEYCVTFEAAWIGLSTLQYAPCTHDESLRDGVVVHVPDHRVLLCPR
jgi:hypothetical protein